MVGKGSESALGIAHRSQMNWQYALVTLSLFASALLATGLALFAWHRRAPIWKRSFAIFMLAAAEWALAYALELTGDQLVIKVFWAKIQYLGIATAPLAWFIFALRYAGREQRWRSPRALIALAAIPALTVLLATTNEAHGLVWAEWGLQRTGPFLLLDLQYGLWFWVNAAYSYVLLLAGTLLLLPVLRRYSWVEARHLALFLLVPILPWLANVISLFDLGPLPFIDFTPVAVTLSGVIMAWGILRHHLFDLVPIARKTVIDSMGDGVLVVNAQGRIVEINPAAEDVLGRQATDLLGQTLPEAFPQWSHLWPAADDEETLETEVHLEQDGRLRYYDVRRSPLYGRDDRFSGNLIVFRDVTQRKAAEEELKASKQLFENLVAVARATSEGPSLQATLQNALDVATHLTGAEFGSLFLLDSSGRVTHSILARGTTAPGSRREIVGKVMDKGLAGWVVRHGQSALVHDTVEDERWLTLPDQPYKVRSVLVVPITSGNDVPGVLTLQHSKPHHFEEEYLTLMQAATDQMALALHNAQIYENQRRLAERQVTLYTALRRIGEHLEPATVAKVAVETIAMLTNWASVAILVPSSDETELVVESAIGLLSPTEGISFAIDNGYSGLAFRSGETQIVADQQSDERDVGDVPGLRSAMVVPLRHGQQRLGAFAVESDEVDAFSSDDVWLAESLAEAISLAMANARLFHAVADEHSRLQALIESSRDGILLVGVNRKILVMNRMALIYLNVPDEVETWINRPVMELMRALRRESPEVVGEAIGEFRRVATGDTGAGEGEFEVDSRALRWVNLPVRAGEEAMGRLVVLQDVTEERTLQQMRDDLTHTMVHDLRNPLNVIYSALEMMNEQLAQKASADIQQMLHISRQSTHRILNLVNGILSISHLESGRMPIMRKSLAMDELVAEVLETERPLADEKGLRLTYEVPQAMPPVMADRSLMERVLQNLVGNAIKFTPTEGLVEVDAEVADGHVMVRVRDTGPGVPSEIQDQLFEKFVTGKQMGRGSGLGLAFCRMAVEAHNGRIWVDSEPGKGATFSFILPLGNGRRMGGEPADYEREVT